MRQLHKVMHRRTAALQTVARRSGVLLTTYGTVLHNAPELARLGRSGPSVLSTEQRAWDWILLDEVGQRKLYVLPD